MKPALYSPAPHSMGGDKNRKTNSKRGAIALMLRAFTEKNGESDIDMERYLAMHAFTMLVNASY